MIFLLKNFIWSGSFFDCSALPKERDYLYMWLLTNEKHEKKERCTNEP